MGPHARIAPPRRRWDMTSAIQVARRAVGLIEDSCNALVQLSTGVGLDVQFEARERLVEARPPMATLNPCSMSLGTGEFRNPPAGVRRLTARMQELERVPAGSVWQAIGIGRANLPMTTIGLAMGGNARTGMEDTLMLRRGVPAHSNAELVQRLARVVRALEREPATVAEVEEALRLPRRNAHA